MKFLLSLGRPNRQQRSVEYDLNRPLPDSAYKSWLIGGWIRDCLALGLYCCERDPSLVQILIDCYRDPLLVKMPIERDDKQQQGEWNENDLLLTTKELTAEIDRWFPKRQQTERHTLLMLHFCSMLVGEATDNVKHGDELPTELLAVMRRASVKWREDY